MWLCAEHKLRVSLKRVKECLSARAYNHAHLVAKVNLMSGPTINVCYQPSTSCAQSKDDILCSGGCRHGSNRASCQCIYIYDFLHLRQLCCMLAQIPGIKACDPCLCQLHLCCTVRQAENRLFVSVFTAMRFCTGDSSAACSTDS